MPENTPSEVPFIDAASVEAQAFAFKKNIDPEAEIAGKQALDWFQTQVAGAEELADDRDQEQPLRPIVYTGGPESTDSFAATARQRRMQEKPLLHDNEFSGK